MVGDAVRRQLGGFVIVDDHDVVGQAFGFLASRQD
jgi:hypothetical protein